MYQGVCKKCGSKNFFAKEGNTTKGLYCSDCGAWVKWLSKAEVRALEHKTACDQRGNAGADLGLSINNNREYYNSLSTEQLVTLLLNQDCEIKELERRLQLLSGCCKFGNPDGTDGACVDCFYDNKDQFERCENFSKKYRNITRE